MNNEPQNNNTEYSPQFISKLEDIYSAFLNDTSLDETNLMNLSFSFGSEFYTKVLELFDNYQFGGDYPLNHEETLKIIKQALDLIKKNKNL